MLIALGLLVALVTVPLARGRLAALADVEFRAGWLALLALGLQILVISVLGDDAGAMSEAVHIGSYVLLAAFVIANRDVPYLWLVALGGLANFVAIVANGGVMPADPDALERAGLETEDGEFANSAAVEDARLQPLGDVFAVPESWPASNVFSVGDVLIVVGAFAAVHTICRSRLALPRFSGMSRATGPAVRDDRAR